MNKKQVTFDRIAANDLYLFTRNERDIYIRALYPIYKNLQKHTVRGDYSSVKAAAAFLPTVRAAARLYDSRFSSPGHSAFGAAEKKAVAKMFVRVFEDEYQNTDF